MTSNVDDVHSFNTGFIQGMKRLKNSEISDENKNVIEKFITKVQIEGLAMGTIVGYLNYITRLAQRLHEMGVDTILTDIEEDDFNKLMLNLQVERELKETGLRTYKKVTKKFFRVMSDDEPPKWVQKLKLKTLDTPVQPSDLLTKEEFDKLMEACRHPRDKALIAVLADGGMRIGALASCRIKHVEFTQYGSMVYLSKTGMANKTTPAKGIPLTWSTGFLNQWIAVHPFKDDPEAPLWVTLNKKHEPMSYKSLRVTIQNVGKKAGIKKRVNPHSFRHMAITHWIYDDLNEQEIKHRAGWSKGSTRMFKVYANFTDKEMNDRIYEKYGIKTEDKRHITLKQCPRCSNVLRPDDRFCSQCSLVLDQQMAREMEKASEQIPDALGLLLSDPSTQAMIAEKMGSSLGEK